MGWITPKTDWKYSDYFNVVDYNRIKNNLLYICNVIGYMTELEIINLRYIPTTAFFHNINSLTNNLYFLITGSNSGLRTNFYENQPAWDAEELNKIESLIAEMYFILQFEKKLPITLGGDRF